MIKELDCSSFEIAKFSILSFSPSITSFLTAVFNISLDVDFLMVVFSCANVTGVAVVFGKLLSLVDLLLT